MRVIVLGAGRVGRAIAWDLAGEPGWEVVAADRSEASLASLDSLPGRPLRKVAVDLTDPVALRRLVSGAELVVGALPSALGFAALEAILETGRDYVDISFFEEDPFALDDLARRREATVVVDCGIAPGCDNLILGYWTTVLDRVERFTCQVGGLPAVRTWPWEYKAPFAPADVLNEYTRPARLVENGLPVVRPALSQPELLDFPGVGTLEAFNTDGLRTLLRTLPDIPWMKEMTLRYPGHAEKMRVLREAGFFSPSPIEVGGEKVVPLAVTSSLLFRAWHLEEGEEDLTAMRVVVEGWRGERQERHTYHLLDRYDPETGLSSMARTTGFHCAAVARLVAEGRFRRPGVWAPEQVGQAPGCYEQVLDQLAVRGVRFEIEVEEIASEESSR